MELDFLEIPKNRKIQIDVREILRLGYTLPCWVSFELAEGLHPVFKLMPGRNKKDEFSAGVAKLQKDGTIKVPKTLEEMTKYAVTYYDRLFEIWFLWLQEEEKSVVFDAQGRITLGKQLAAEMGYTNKTVFRLVYEGSRIYRLARKEELTDADKIVGYDIKMDEKTRIIVPKEVRNLYNNHMLVYGVKNTSSLYLEFQITKHEERLSTALESLTAELKKFNQR